MRSGEPQLQEIPSGFVRVVAAGNIFDQVIYRTVYENICYEAVFYMHSGNIGNYTPGTVVEFDRGTLLQKFEGILDTFTVQ